MPAEADAWLGISCACDFIHILTGKWLEVLTPNLVHMPRSCHRVMAGPWHVLTLRLKGQKSKLQGYEVCCCADMVLFVIVHWVVTLVSAGEDWHDIKSVQCSDTAADNRNGVIPVKKPAQIIHQESLLETRHILKYPQKINPEKKPKAEIDFEQCPM